MEDFLSQLIHSKTKSEFLDSYKANEPVVVHKLGDIAKELIELPFLQSLESLFNFWPKTVDGYQPGIADEVNSKTTSVSEARELFKQGRGLIFNDADTESEVLKKWVNQLIAELGLSSLTYGRSLIYAIPAGAGTDAHFDQNINFVFQIKGVKKWKVAPNTHVINPMTRHTIGTEPDPELASYTEGMPEAMPSDATEYTLTPGSFLFVPRGAWHSTEASGEDSLSISFTFTAPTWIDMLTTALRVRFSQSSVWRETANFVNSQEHLEDAIETFDALLQSLASDVPHWRAEDIIGAMEQHELTMPDDEA